MATVFKLTITIGKGEAQRTREIVIDPEEISMGTLEDLDSVRDSKSVTAMKPILADLLGLTDEEFRALTVKQFMQIANAIPQAIAEATTIPNGTAPLSG